MASSGRKFYTWQADLAFMPKYGRVTGFLACVDLGSRKIYTRTITTKSVTSIKRKFENIFEKDCDNQLRLLQMQARSL